MDTSDNSGFLFRNTSLTIRLRFTPAMACSTRTRICASLRLARFSAFVSSRPRGFFFRLAGLLDRRLVPLKTGILVQDGPGWIMQLRLVRDALVMGLAGIRPTEEQDAFTGTAHHEYVLVGVGFLLAAVVQRLFFGLFRPFPTPLGAVDDDQPGPSGFGRLSVQLVAVALREDAQIVQGRACNREQVMQPIIRLGGTDAKQLLQDDLERIRFQVDQDEQQFVRVVREGAVPTRARPALARLTRRSSIPRVSAGVGPLEGGQQFAKLGVGQAGQRQKRLRLARQGLRTCAGILRVWTGTRGLGQLRLVTVVSTPGVWHGHSAPQALSQ
jgi:hypothetical protein